MAVKNEWLFLTFNWFIALTEGGIDGEVMIGHVQSVLT